MKFLLYLLVAGSLLAACNNGQGYKEPPPAGAKDLTDIQWIDSVKEMGKINEGQVLDVSFRFKNTGNKPLVISNARASCGCTVPDPPKEPIAPGAEGAIKASFNSKGRPGHNHKEIDVEANTTGSPWHKVVFNVEVLPQQQ